MLLVAALLVFAAIVAYGVSSIIASNKPFVEQALAERLKAHVEIKELGVSWGVHGAVFALKNVKIGFERPMLREIVLQRIDTDIDLLGSLMALTPQISSLDLHGIAIDVAASPLSMASAIRELLNTPHTEPPQTDTLLAFFSSLRSFSISDSTLSMQNDDGTTAPLLDITFRAHRIFGSFDLLATICPRQSTTGGCTLIAKGSLTVEKPANIEGTLVVSGEKLPLPLAPLFDRPFYAEQLFARVHFKVEQGLSNIEIADVRYKDANLDLGGDIAIQHDTGHARTGFDLNLKILRADANKASRYIPSAILPISLTRWLDRALVSGSVENGSIRIKGDLPNIPRHDGDTNLFAISLGLKQVRLKFDPHWPEIRELHGTLIITPKSLAIAVHKGISQGVIIEKAKVTLADFADPAQKLLLNLDLAASSAEAQAYFDQSPLASSLGGLARQVEMPQSKIALQLLLPLGQDLASSLSGSVQLDNTTLTHRESALPLTNIRGKVSFTGDTLDARDLKTLFLGMPLVIDLADDSFSGHKPVFIKIKGIADMHALATKSYPSILKIAEGRSAFTANLVLMNNKTGMTANLDLRSALEGIAVHAPQVYTKEKKTPANLHILASIDEKSRAILHATLDDVWVFHSSSGPQLDFFSTIAGYFYRTPSALADNKSTQKFMIDIPRIKGAISRPTAGGGLLFDFAKIEIDDTQGHEDETSLKGPQKDAAEKTQFGAFGLAQFKIAELRYKGMQFQNMEATVTGTEHGIYAAPFLFTTGDSRFKWDKAAFERTGSGYTTRLEGEVQTASLGALLQSQEIFTNLRGLKGNARFALHWAAEPWLFDKKILEGTVNVDLADGRLHNSNSILNRIVDLLTLNLQQTLKSDIDIKTVKGQLTLADGIVATDGFSIDLTGAKTEAHGKVNLVDETIDSKVDMTVDISRLLKIGLAFVINPVVGGLYWWKGDPSSIPIIDNLTRHSYEIKGPWQAPTITMLPLIKLPI